MSSSRKIGVLLGGLAVERDASVRTGEAVLAALRQRGYDAQPLFVDRDLDIALRQTQVDLAFLAARGRFGADGCLQGLLELLGIPYTGSGALACGLAANRAKVKEVLRWHNLPTAPGYVMLSHRAEKASEIHGSFGYPAVIRPVSAPLLLGGTLVRDEMELESALDDVFRLEDQAVVERLVDGRVMCVAVLDGVALGAVEVPRSASWTGLRSVGLRVHEVCTPTQLSPSRYASVMRLASQAYEAVGCEGAACVEIVVSEKLNETILDIDTAPALLPGSPLPRIAHEAGIEFADLMEEILNGARLRSHGAHRNRRLVQADVEGSERPAEALSAAH